MTIKTIRIDPSLQPRELFAGLIGLIEPDPETNKRKVFKMKLFKRSNTFKAANVTLNATTLDAHSYGWWRFVARINGKVIFNNYPYSNSTRKHQSKVRGQLREMGIKIDREMYLPSGINSDSIKDLNQQEKDALKRKAQNEELKRLARNRKARERRAAKKRETANSRDTDWSSSTAAYFRDNPETQPAGFFGRNFTLIQGGRQW